MSRTGFLIVGALIFALAAAGVLVWTNNLELPSGILPQSAEAKLVTQMTGTAGEGGFAVTFAQRDLKAWQIAPGHRLERFSVDGGDAVFARLTSSSPLDRSTLEWPTQGLSVALPVDLNARSDGKQLEIGVLARAPNSKPATTLSVVYATRQAGNTGWREVPLSGQFELKTIKYNVPHVDGGYTNPPVLVLNADPSGEGGSVEILGVYLKITAPQAASGPPSQ
jgi:hypothetical protein